jgi:lysophosphatidate acyltransferase
VVFEFFLLFKLLQNNFSLKVMMKMWPGGNCTPLAKKELLYAGPFGITCWLCGVIFIDRLNQDKAKDTINCLVNRIQNENVMFNYFLS